MTHDPHRSRHHRSGEHSSETQEIHPVVLILLLALFVGGLLGYFIYHTLSASEDRKKLYESQSSIVHQQVDRVEREAL